MENQNNPEIISRIEAALDTIRPYLKADGGDVKVLEITPEMILKLEMVGACGSCPMSTMTFKSGIEQSVMKAVPEIKGVEAINITPFAEVV